MTEKQWEANVIQLATTLGWRHYHTHDSRRSPEGFPDLVLAHPRKGILYRELKVGDNKPTVAQVEWLLLLAAAGGDVDVWYPKDIDRVRKELGG